MPAAIPFIVIALLYLVTFIVRLAFVIVGVQVVRAMFNKVAGPLRFIPWVKGMTASAVHSIENHLTAAMGNSAAAMSPAIARWFNGMSELTLRIGAEVNGLAQETYDAMHRLNAKLARQIARSRAEAIGKATTAGKVAGATVTPSVAAQRRWVRARLRELARSLDARIATAIDAAIPGTLTMPRARLGYLERIYRGLRAKVSEHTKLLVGAGAFAFVMSKLAKIGLGCLFGRNGRKAVKQLCRVNPSFFDAFLADTLLLFSVVSLVEFAEELQKFEAVIADAVRGFIRELPKGDPLAEAPETFGANPHHEKLAAWNRAA